MSLEYCKHKDCTYDTDYDDCCHGCECEKWLGDKLDDET